MSAFTLTDDSTDPCGYCIVWEEPEGDPNEVEARPVWPDGKTVERLYRFTHAACYRAVMAYVMETSADQ